NPLATLNLSYGALDGVVYAQTAANGGNDANPGTFDSPKLTIPAAIAVADALYVTAEVHVAAGTYNVNSQAGTHVIMAEGIALYGGYSSSDLAIRDAATYPTTITDTSTLGGTGASPNRAIEAGSGITTATIIDGFTINGGGGGWCSAIFNIGASPTISNAERMTQNHSQGSSQAI
ncbi:MAG: DUF1565 domain-containing protein, partial [Acidobacteria bacterium]|nr:DUF1565 domain-containing protein [Acidobacteriota bacterium]